VDGFGNLLVEKMLRGGEESCLKKTHGSGKLGSTHGGLVDVKPESASTKKRKAKMGNEIFIVIALPLGELPA